MSPSSRLASNPVAQRRVIMFKPQTHTTQMNTHYCSIRSRDQRVKLTGVQEGVLVLAVLVHLWKTSRDKAQALLSSAPLWLSCDVPCTSGETGIWGIWMKRKQCEDRAPSRDSSLIVSEYLPRMKRRRPPGRTTAGLAPSRRRSAFNAPANQIWPSAPEGSSCTE